MKKVLQGKKSFIGFFEQVNKRSVKQAEKKAKSRYQPCMEQLNMDNVAFLSDN